MGNLAAGEQLGDGVRHGATPALPAQRDGGAQVGDVAQQSQLQHVAPAVSEG